MVFLYSSPTELVLEIEASVRSQSARQSQQISHGQGRWNAYLNAMSVQTVLSWFQEDYSTEARIWLANELPDLWGAVDGAAIEIGGRRFVIISNKQLETSEFIVSQEWIDIPTWAGDYFLAIQIDPAGEWLRIWGYTTHEQLKTLGKYNSSDRNYTLDATQLVEDITALSVIYQLNSNEQTQAAIQPLPTLTNSQIQTLWQGLIHIESSEIRCVLPFQQWGRLLVQTDTRHCLYELWRSPNLSRNIINLANWLQHQFEESWQSIDQVSVQPQLAYSLRQSTNATEICRARSVRLGAEHEATLVVMLEPERGILEGSILVENLPPEIRVRLYPGDRAFPNHLTLALLTETGEIVQSVQANEQAEFIQLKRFRCRFGTSFKVQIAIDQPIFTELFVN